MYDWANSAFFTTIVAAVFPVYFTSVAAADLPPAVATARFALATTIAVTCVAVLAPLLGAVADYAAVKKKILAVFLSLGTLATAAMVLIQRGDWLLASGLFILADIGAAASLIFYDALLPHIARREELDRVSTAGYALGYLGGGLLLALNLLWIQQPHWFGLADAASGARLSFLAVALWWLGFSLPLFRYVAEPQLPRAAFTTLPVTVVRAPLTQLRTTFKTLRTYHHAFLFLTAFLLYNDGIGTIIRMAVVYGGEIGIPPSALLGAILLVQCIGLPCAFLFGALAAKIGTRAAIFLTLAVYSAVSVMSYYMQTALHFYVVAILVGMVQGGSQALSRSLFASMIPRARSAEFFALFGVCEKFTGLLGPAIFTVMVTASGSSRNAVLSVLLFFVLGGVLLARVDVAAGQRAVSEAVEDAP
jgi:MFS transporter, UMF1 family